VKWTVIDEGAEPDLKEFEKAISKALKRSGLIAQRLLSTPPGKKPGEKHLNGPLPGGFYTNKQAKYVAIGIKMGTIEVPYMRTANLPRSWSTSRPMRSVGGELSVVTFSDVGEAPYNEWVQQTNRNAGRRQVKMHKDWPTPNSVADKHEDKILEPVRKEIVKWGFTWS
jgi:hypothetical protein